MIAEGAPNCDRCAGPCPSCRSSPPCGHRQPDIIVNGRRLGASHWTMSHEYIVGVASQGRPTNDTWTVTYKSKNQQGTLAPGHSIGVEHGMVFNAMLTNRA